MPRKLKVGSAVLCEHIVLGANNKHTLINVFSGNIVIWSPLPATLTLALYVELLDRCPRLDIEMRMDGETFVKVAAGFPSESPDATPYVFVLPLFQVGIDRDLDFDVVAAADGFARTTLMKKRISAGSPPAISPNALPPPSEQSQPVAPASSKPRARRRPSSPKL